MSFFEELKRRNVIRVGIAYVVLAWLVAQVAELALDTFNAPDWVMQSTLLVLMLGLPLAIFLAWAFELTPDGIRKEDDVERSASVTHRTRRKLDVVIIAVLALALAYFFWESRLADAPPSEPIADQLDRGAEPAPGGSTRRDRSVGVLPFANRSNLEDDLFFTDGIHDDLLTQLAKIDGVRVISRTTMMQYRDTKKSIPQIAEELGVGSILEGGVQRAGQRIRINAQLIDVARDGHLWAETFDREMTVDNLFDIQSEITRRIVTAVKGQLTPEEQRILDDKPTDSLAAWEAYSRAREIVRTSSYGPVTYRLVEPLLEQAIELDPKFYRAHAMLVAALGQSYWLGYGQSDEVRVRAEAALEAVDALAQQSVEAVAARGHYHYRFKRDFETALTAYQRAVALKPGDSDLLRSLAWTQRRRGLHDASVETFLRAYDADPGNARTIAGLFDTMIDVGMYDRAAQLLPAARARFPGYTDLACTDVFLSLAAHGDTERASAVHEMIIPPAEIGYFFQRATEELAWMKRDPDAVLAAWERSDMQAFTMTDPYYVAERQLQLGWLYQLIGEEESSSGWLEEGIELLAEAHTLKDPQNRSAQLATTAQIYALQGNREGALRTARESIEALPLEDDLWEAPRIHMRAWRAIAIAGNRDEALENIRALFALKVNAHRWQLYLDPRWDFFRDDERFNALVRPDGLDPEKHIRNPLQ